MQIYFCKYLLESRSLSLRNMNLFDFFNSWNSFRILVHETLFIKVVLTLFLSLFDCTNFSLQYKITPNKLYDIIIVNNIVTAVIVMLHRILNHVEHHSVEDRGKEPKRSLFPRQVGCSKIFLQNFLIKVRRIIHGCFSFILASVMRAYSCVDQGDASQYDQNLQVVRNQTNYQPIKMNSPWSSANDVTVGTNSNCLRLTIWSHKSWH